MPDTPDPNETPAAPSADDEPGATPGGVTRRVWRRTAKPTEPALAEPAATSPPRGAPAIGERQPRERKAGGYRMQLGSVAEEEARAHLEQQRIDRVQGQRTWLARLFVISLLTLVLYAIGGILALAGAAPLVVIVFIASFIPGSLAAWVIGLNCAIRLRERMWILAIGLGPILVVVLAGLVSWNGFFVYPVYPIVLGLVYPVSKRDDVFAVR